jgi:glyoxylase-like metal-dependent hydrolase (beta-lactamase superfamily II)
MTKQTIIHRFPHDEDSAFVNAYLVETESSVVAIDSLLTVSESRALRVELEKLGKPLRAILLTHSHPDHYGGLTRLVAGDDVPIIAPRGVIDTITRDDELKEQILRPMFGDDWEKERTFPNTPIADGETFAVDDAVFRVIDLGPSESPHDSPWVLGDDERIVFLGDQIYGRKHCFLADGFFREWLQNIERLRRRFPDDAVFYIGHGGPASSSDWDWQRTYITTFIDAVTGADWSDPDRGQAAVVAEMKAFLPSEDLQFLIELSIEPVAGQLGLVEGRTGAAGGS